MFDFGNANQAQRQAISTADGPVLITAGPGTGKTYTLVQRTIYLIEECGVAPEHILIATFTEKAAKELVTRITNELARRDITANLNEMYVGTFHSLCLRILKEHLEYTRLRRNYRMLDAFDQHYTVFLNLKKRFMCIPGIQAVLTSRGAWKQAGELCGYVNNLEEELVDPEALQRDGNPAVAVLGKVMQAYRKMLVDGNLIDFSAIQTEAYDLLRKNPEVLAEIQGKISHLMIDEYQDTNYIQEQLTFLIAGERQNICVVGDDDQGLYRFRGATIRNILEFPKKFAPGRCKTVSLVVNYRSNSDIVNFYNQWMATTQGNGFSFAWDGFRYDKQIVAQAESTLDSPAVVKLAARNNVGQWQEKILAFLTRLRESGKLTNYNQVAFLFNSVKKPQVTALARFLEEHQISVYSPRSDMFFQRREIQLVMGVLMLLFPGYVKGLKTGAYRFLSQKDTEYYLGCAELARGLLQAPENAALNQWVREKRAAHANLRGSTDYAYSGLLYQLFAFEPFASILDTDLDVGVVDARPARNLAKFTQIIGKYEHLEGIDTLSASKLTHHTEILLNLYLRLLYEGGITEYEDDMEYAPSGCVSFLTIHQAKGMEFPIVIVDSLESSPWRGNNPLMAQIEKKYFKRPAFEPEGQTKYFDFWRQYYTAFSRAQDLLVLTCNEDKYTPSLCFAPLYSRLPGGDGPGFDLSQFQFRQVKAVNIKPTFSFTSHITVYETCPLQYKFYKELDFSPVRANAMLFGILVHETIEDVHKAVLRHEEHLVTRERVAQWFDANYTTLSQMQHAYLAPAQKAAALGQVQRYVDRQQGDWSAIRQAEVDVSLVKPEYILEGKIDLVRGVNGTVEIVDFKSEKKPDQEQHRERLEQYRRQLHVYAHLVEQRTGQKVSRMHLYYTGQEEGVPTITFPYTKEAVEDTITAFDSTVKKIMDKDFACGTRDKKVCGNCDFRYYCKRREAPKGEPPAGPRF